MPRGEPEKIHLGVSSCLLGDEVRDDGGHERDAFLTALVLRRAVPL